MYKLSVDKKRVNKISPNGRVTSLKIDNQNYIEWLSKGNIPVPAETAEEIKTREQTETNQKALSWLKKNTHKLLKHIRQERRGVETSMTEPQFQLFLVEFDQKDALVKD